MEIRLHIGRKQWQAGLWVQNTAHKNTGIYRAEASYKSLREYGMYNRNFTTTRQKNMSVAALPEFISYES